MSDVVCCGVGTAGSETLEAAELSVRSVNPECLARLIPLGEGSPRCAQGDCLAHCNVERNHQGLATR